MSLPTQSAERSTISPEDGMNSEPQPPQCSPFDPIQLESSPSDALSEKRTPSFKPHPEFWLDDGNLVLVIKPHDIAFRIYAGLLASQSEVFEGLFEVANASPDEVFDGCPIVPIYDDTPGEFAHFLRVLLPKDSRCLHRTAVDTSLTFDHTAAVIRLANKYGLPAIRDEALDLLQTYNFPSTAPRSPYIACPNPVILVEDIHAIGVVNIAHLVDKPKLLYPALYRCVVLGSAVLDGWTRDDGVVEHLLPQDLRLCMDAHAALTSARVAIFATMFADMSHQDCENARECRAGLRALEDAMLLDEFGSRLDIFVEGDIEKRAAALGVCKRCQAMLKRRRDEEQRKVWRRLPKLFGIKDEGWLSDTNEDSSEDDDTDGDQDGN